MIAGASPTIWESLTVTVLATASAESSATTEPKDPNPEETTVIAPKIP